MLPGAPPPRTPINGPVHARDIPTARPRRFKSELPPLDRALGGGFVAPSVALVWGMPGARKTTRVARAADRIARARGGTAFYASSEAPAALVKRLAENERAPRLSSSWIWYEKDFRKVLTEAHLRSPSVFVGDSVQAFQVGKETSTDASILYVIREAAELARAYGTLVLLISQVNSEGSPWGPRNMLHAVDTTIQLWPDRLKVHKNRFAPSPREAAL